MTKTSASKTTCKQCGRDERFTTAGIRQITVNKDGICPVCVEVNAEVAFEDKERGRMARAHRDD